MENPSIMNHVSIGVSDGEVSLPFYDKVLATIGAQRIVEHDASRFSLGPGVCSSAI